MGRRGSFMVGRSGNRAQKMGQGPGGGYTGDDGCFAFGDRRRKLACQAGAAAPNPTADRPGPTPA
jgi:hypothetical protein